MDQPLKHFPNWKTLVIKAIKATKSILYSMATRRGVKELKIEDGQNSGVCDFCQEKGKMFKLLSRHRKYRFLNVCSDCLTKIRSGFNKQRK